MIAVAGITLKYVVPIHCNYIANDAVAGITLKYEDHDRGQY